MILVPLQPCFFSNQNPGAVEVSLHAMLCISVPFQCLVLDQGLLVLRQDDLRQVCPNGACSNPLDS